MIDIDKSLIVEMIYEYFIRKQFVDEDVFRKI